MLNSVLRPERATSMNSADGSRNIPFDSLSRCPAASVWLGGPSGLCARVDLSRRFKIAVTQTRIEDRKRGD